MTRNIMDVDGYKAVISYDPEIEMFRGEFLGLNGGADFYAADVRSLQKEGRVSLRVFLEECAAQGIAPRKTFSGKFMLRIDPQLHEIAATKAAAEGKSLNQLAEEAIRSQVALEDEGLAPAG